MPRCDDEEQAAMVFQIFKQAMVTRAIETDLSVEDRAQHVAYTSALVAAELDPDPVPDPVPVPVPVPAWQALPQALVLYF